MRHLGHSQSRPDKPSQPNSISSDSSNFLWDPPHPTLIWTDLAMAPSCVKIDSVLPLIKLWADEQQLPWSFPVKEISCITHIYMLSTKPLIYPFRNIEPLWVTSAHNPVSACAHSLSSLISHSCYSSDFEESTINSLFNSVVFPVLFALMTVLVSHIWQ